ncbi:hypothetical protein [Streptomyces sp. NBC_01304]|uniref:hypothetical protein n=1 Tax=Streptomyces sp. NBC_01304 TaxID=2903818 RepID=UPI002E0EBF94|nr:hypothetical protein OG430_44650 [Streptomyces sp. NBC_01304]
MAGLLNREGLYAAPYLKGLELVRRPGIGWRRGEGFHLSSQSGGAGPEYMATVDYAPMAELYLHGTFDFAKPEATDAKEWDTAVAATPLTVGELLLEGQRLTTRRRTFGGYRSDVADVWDGWIVALYVPDDFQARYGHEPELTLQWFSEAQIETMRAPVSAE